MSHTDHHDSNTALARWRLILGRFAEQQLPGALGMGDDYPRMDRVLQYLYGREYGDRGVREDEARTGGMDASMLSVPAWIREARALFPRETMETLEQHALHRYGMTELVTDPRVLERLEPSYELMKAILTFRELMPAETLEVARRIVRQMVDELSRTLASEVRPVLWGRLNRRQRSRQQTAANLDVPRTIRANLKHYDPERRRLLVEQIFFASRTKRHLPWHIILCVDCSGSMLDSVIHSAVMAGIFHGLPAVRVSLVAFDTSIVDMTAQVDDPLAVLMSVQLGGGTDIYNALRYCEGLVESPARTILVLITDFFEGNSPEGVISMVTHYREAGVRVLGLAALDADARPVYDHALAQRCADAGAEIAALTPRRLAEWMDNALS
ncbi:MAG TPA: VWA domain-containing protein [Armatimonadota bacterium]|nr:VWA domain-containing protein [Armatimonadota bacterium]